MFASRAIRMAAVTRLASDTATLAQAADPNHMCLIMSDFIPSEDLVIADVDLATFDGGDPLEIELGVQPSGFEPGSDDSSIDFAPPVGGFRWETTGTTNLPMTIYGFCVTNEAETTLLCSELFDTPIVLTGINQVIDIPRAELILPKDSFSS